MAYQECTGYFCYGVLVTTFFTYAMFTKTITFFSERIIRLSRIMWLKGNDTFNFGSLDINAKHCVSRRHHHFSRYTFIISLLRGFLEGGMKWKELFYLIFFSGGNDKLKDV